MMEMGAIKLADKVEGIIAEMENSLSYMKELLGKAVSVEDVVTVASELKIRFIENKYRADKIVIDQIDKVMAAIPAAACNRCGGWTNSGGMSQHAKSDVKVMGRTGCVCHRQIAAV